MKTQIMAFLSLIMMATFANACPTGLREFNKLLDGKKTCVLEGTYVGTLELTSGYNYLLLGAIYVGSEKRDNDLTLKEPIQSGRLVINPGVSIFALNPAKDKTNLWQAFKDKNGIEVQGDIKSFISVTRDSQIEVKGTESSPVLMTSAQGAHMAQSTVAKAPGDWGGLVISGKAKTNKCNDFETCTIPGEANTGWYGGNDDFHSSGSLQYLQVEFGGDRIDEEKELNGITFNSVGLGTLIDNIAVLYNSDDCVEFFGGAVTGRNIFCYKGEDDGIDTTDGARIFLQNGIVVASDYPEAGEDNDRHMVEADSAKTDDASLKLRSHPVLVNFSFIGGVNSQGLKLRRGTNYTLVNSVMVGVDLWCMDPTGAMDLFLTTNVFADCKSSDPVNAMTENEFSTANVLELKKWLPSQTSPLLKGAQYLEEFFPADLDLDEAFADVYEEVDYRGAIGDKDWTAWIQLRD
jgi:trimeric autotransporter adhesin